MVEITGGSVKSEYSRVSEFLEMRGEALALHIARLGEIIHRSHKNKTITIMNLSQLAPCIFFYLVGRDKLTDQYRYRSVSVVDDYAASLMSLLVDYMKFTYGLELKY